MRELAVGTRLEVDTRSKYTELTSCRQNGAYGSAAWGISESSLMEYEGIVIEKAFRCTDKCIEPPRSASVLDSEASDKHRSARHLTRS